MRVSAAHFCLHARAAGWPVPKTGNRQSCTRMQELTDINHYKNYLQRKNV